MISDSGYEFRIVTKGEVVKTISPIELNRIIRILQGFFIIHLVRNKLKETKSTSDFFILESGKLDIAFVALSENSLSFALA